MSSAQIEIVNLRKEYKDFVAVNDLTLSVKKNSFTGLLGPNGAGKSTTLKILTHLINATSGNAYINGIDVTSNPKDALEGIGTVVETPEFYSYLTPTQTFQYIGSIFGMRKETISAETSEILADMSMSEWADKKIGTFSKGMKQRIALGLALLNEPTAIILDEPTSGLDPRGMAEMRKILKDIRAKKDLTILTSSHMLHEVSDMCDRIAMINHGTLVKEGDLNELLGSNNARMITVKTVGGFDDAMISKLSALSNVSNVMTSGNVIKLSFKGDDEDQYQLLSEMSSLGMKVFSFNEEDALETIYLNMIKESR
ncbi:ABC transporter ATP-binding protein [Candidatus Methanarcanum hacksteinii]|uniref:ABC transporter ATP-binding protein n=1 Tax=Candidatus Methanarcanum hacksteinii TaxID=2911857 RepID=UPI0037DCC8AE|nr:MAG: multidrug ABC transporter ATP-binding protein [Candidatus Methanarcanum hacksteinii]